MLLRAFETGRVRLQDILHLRYVGGLVRTASVAEQALAFNDRIGELDWRAAGSASGGMLLQECGLHVAEAKLSDESL